MLVLPGEMGFFQEREQAACQREYAPSLGGTLAGVFLDVFPGVFLEVL
jgi:hypothetical protein